MDIATLGIKIDSSDAPRAAKELDRLKTAAGGAEQAAAKLGKAAGPGLAAVESSARRAGVSVEEFRARMAKASENVAKNFPLMSKGVNGTSEALGDLDEKTKRTERSTSNLANTLTRRFVVGYAVSQIRTLGRALVNLAGDMARVGDLGRLTGLGSQGIQGITSAAGAKGINADTFSGAMVAFNQQLPLAKSGVGELGALLRGNKITVSDTGDAFFKVADLVRNAKNDTAALNILRQAGLPPTLEMLRLMKQGGDEIKNQISLTDKLSDAQVDAAKKARDAWYTTWQGIMDKGAQVLGNIVLRNQEITRRQNEIFLKKDPNNLALRFDVSRGDLDAVETSTDKLKSALDRRARVLRGDKETVDPATEKAIAQDRISRAQQYLGLLGQTTTALEARRAVELQIASAGLNGVGIDSARAETLKRLAVEQNLGITAMKSSADAARVETDTVGMSVGAAAEYVAVQTKLNEARRNGVVISPEHVDAIRREAAALGEAAQHADTMRWSYTNLIQGPLQTFRSSLASGAKGFDALKAAGVSALNAISTKLMDMAAQNLWQAAMGGKSGGGGFLSSIFSLFGGGGGPTNIIGGAGSLPVPTFSAKGNVFDSAPGLGAYRNQILSEPTIFAFAKGGIGVAGEVPGAKEAVMPLVRTPGGNLGVRATGGNSASAVNVYMTQHNTFTGADPGSEARLRGALEKTKREAISEATQAVAKVYASNSSYLKGRT